CKSTEFTFSRMQISDCGDFMGSASLLFPEDVILWFQILCLKAVDQKDPRDPPKQYRPLPLLLIAHQNMRGWLTFTYTIGREAGATFTIATAGEGPGQLSHLLQVVRALNLFIFWRLFLLGEFASSCFRALSFDLADLFSGWNVTSSDFYKAGFVNRYFLNLVLSSNVLFTPSMVIESFPSTVLECFELDNIFPFVNELSVYPNGLALSSFSLEGQHF
ncbi:hypothetical protein STEG23_003521, partial [Scotinomys teguina]